MKNIKKFEDYEHLNEEEEYDDDYTSTNKKDKTINITKHTITVGKLIKMLNKFDKNDDIYFFYNKDLGFPQSLSDKGGKVHFNLSDFPNIDDED